MLAIFPSIPALLVEYPTVPLDVPWVRQGCLGRSLGRPRENEEAKAHADRSLDVRDHPARDGRSERFRRRSDGRIGGHVDEARYDVGSSYLVVDTGPWIFGKKVLLPAGALTRVDLDNKKVYVRLTKDQIKTAPEFDERTYMSKDYRDRIVEHYGAMV